MPRSADSPEDDYIAAYPAGEGLRRVIDEEQRTERDAPYDTDFLRRKAERERLALVGDETDQLVREACDQDDPDDTTADAMAALALSCVLEAADVGLRSAVDIDSRRLELSDLITALNRLRGFDGQPGIISQLQMIQRDLEDAAITKLPKAAKGQRAAKGQPEKWTELDGLKLEHTVDTKWAIESKRALTRLFADVPEQSRSPEVLADVVTTHISGIDGHWRVTELEESLGGPIIENVPELDAAGDPVLYTRGPNKGQPKVRVEKRSRLIEEEWGDRTEGREIIRVHKGEADA